MNTDNTDKPESPPLFAPAGSEWQWRIVNSATQQWVSRHRSWKGANLRLTRLQRYAPKGLYFMERLYPKCCHLWVGYGPVTCAFCGARYVPNKEMKTDTPLRAILDEWAADTTGDPEKYWHQLDAAARQLEAELHDAKRALEDVTRLGASEVLKMENRRLKGEIVILAAALKERDDLLGPVVALLKRLGVSRFVDLPPGLEAMRHEQLARLRAAMGKEKP